MHQVGSRFGLGCVAQLGNCRSGRFAGSGPVPLNRALAPFLPYITRTAYGYSSSVLWRLFTYTIHRYTAVYLSPPFHLHHDVMTRALVDEGPVPYLFPLSDLSGIRRLHWGTPVWGPCLEGACGGKNLPARLPCLGFGFWVFQALAFRTDSSGNSDAGVCPVSSFKLCLLLCFLRCPVWACLSLGW
jgi:hypothetical protein